MDPDPDLKPTVPGNLILDLLATLDRAQGTVEAGQKPIAETLQQAAAVVGEGFYVVKPTMSENMIASPRVPSVPTPIPEVFVSTDAVGDVNVLPSGEVVFVMTNIEGSTKLFRELGDGYVDVLDAHNSLLWSAVRARDGVEVGTEGD